MKNDYELSPITEKHTVIKIDDLNLCFESGYHCYDNWDLAEFKKKSPPEIVESEFVAPDGVSWFKIAMFTKQIGLIPKNDNWIIVEWQTDGTYNFLPTETQFEHFEDAYNEFQKLKNAN